MKIDQLNEEVYFSNVDSAPSSFQRGIYNIAARRSDVIVSNNVDTSNGNVVIEFGRGSSLPTEQNTVVVGNKYHGKVDQTRKLQRLVPTIKTFRDALEVQGRDFIAKKDHGQQQQGQLINELPDDPEGFIFQPLVNILAEFRVITYYMNRQYYTSGIYQKSGSNASYRSIAVNSRTGSTLSKIAKLATMELGYGVGGADIAIIDAENKADIGGLQENVTGRLASAAGRFAGRLSYGNLEDMLKGHFPVVLEVNTYPSMQNPMIYFDLIESMLQNAR